LKAESVLLKCTELVQWRKRSNSSSIVIQTEQYFGKNVGKLLNEDNG
jgi:hypothetical protein